MRRQLVTATLGLLALLHRPSLAGAEIAIAPSIEWLTASATRIVAGKIVALKPAAPDASGKNRGLSLATLQVLETVKGVHEPKLCIGLRDLDPRQLERLRVAGVELLLFLDRTIQATSFEIEVPFRTEVHAVLSADSACCLEVPELLFPKARALGR